MSNIDDFEIRPQDEPTWQAEEEPELEDLNDENAGRGTVIAMAVVLVLLLAGGAFVLYRLFWSGTATEPPAAPVQAAQASEPVPPPPPEPAAAPPPEPEPEPFQMPTLQESDAVVRTLVGGLSSHPSLARWLATDEILRRTARVVANIAYGENPAAHLGFMRPQDAFRVTQSDGAYHVDPRTYERYDLPVDVFVALDVGGTVALYHKLEPLLQEAYTELGYPERRFDVALHRAVDQLLEVPALEPELELKPRVISYELADPALESLTDAQKMLLRSGPDNVLRVKAKLRRLSHELWG